MYAPTLEESALHRLPRPALRRASDGRRSVRRLITRYFFATAAIAFVVDALLLALLPSPVEEPVRLALIGAHVVLALCAALAIRARGIWVERLMVALLVATAGTITASALVYGLGLVSPGLGFFALLVCVASAAAGRRAGLLLAAVSALGLVVVTLGERSGLAAAPQHVDDWPLQLGMQLLLVGLGLASGLLVSFVVSRFVRSADERERRFSGLLAIAADAYWEIDQAYRLVEVINQRVTPPAPSVIDGIGHVPWELPSFDCDAETLDALLADLDTRVPFRDRAVRWRVGGGAPRSLVVSGEPRFDERGVFVGYWGVARDVSDELAARQSLLETETRYQALFERIPTPLVLHRHGAVIDANAAGVALFGHSALDTLLGRDLLAAYESGDSRERERRRLDELVEAPPGDALPVADFRLSLPDGRRVSVRATGVRVEAAGGPATLSIYVDDTERRTAEEAVRRSETMLSHLVATSPDVITLTDMATGRYAMVNQTFERLVGYSSSEVLGRTSLELGVWVRGDDRAHFIAQVREHGSATDMPTQFVTKSGRAVSMLVSGARFVMDRREYLVINARDVTEAEHTRLEREAILQNASIGIAVTRDRRFVLANPALERMYGWSPGSLVGQPGRVVWPSDEAYAEIGNIAAPLLGRGEQLEIERLAMRRDGSSFLARILAKAIDPHSPGRGGTIWLIEDVTERRQFEQALADARDAAEAASRAKSAFLANTSHELRTPLNGMLHLAQLARDPALAEDRRRHYLDQIADSAQSLAVIISDILDLSKIEAGKLELESMPFALDELLHTLQRGYAAQAVARSLALELDLGAGVAGTVAGDPLRVRQILSNYISNALKFTARGHVRVSARRLDERRVRFEVDDSGPGIAAETQARLFRPFTQADESTTRRYGGTGLGLSICRELAELMGGEVGVVSEPGRGSRFWAELPLPSAAPAAPAPAADDDSHVLRGARVLMAEDNPVNMLIAVALLERWGVRVEQAADGQQAVAAVQRAASLGRPFDAVLMDVQMPVMSGHEATRALRQQDWGRELPIIALTAAALVSERQAAMDAGMDDFLTKPIDADRLRATLARWVARKR